jgi:pyruvate/2-oxoglutarate dehydrogenase complex dihydrolipoamide dehydrogenase (E3) component
MAAAAGQDDAPTLMPHDEANRALLDAVHPADWVNPTPRAVYDLVVVGGGTAGLVSAVGAAGLGARVALVERHLLGGDCLNVGCVPSKALICSARAAADARRAAGLGVNIGNVEPDFDAIMQRMRERRAGIGPNDSAQRLQQAGVDVFFGSAAFTSARALDVHGVSLRFRRAVITTGARPTAPPVPGLSDIDFLTNETLFSLTELPRRLLVIGGGPIGCELAQAFARFGSAVTVFDQAAHLLPREDSDAAAVVQRRLVKDGIDLQLGVKLVEATDDGGEVCLRFERPSGAGITEVRGDRLLVSAGRAPNIEGLGLDAAGVSVSRRGVIVDDRLRTSNRRIYAAGDVCSAFQFTHAADAMARIVIRNALFYGRRRVSALVIPWCTYTDPEVAHVGVYEQEARERGHDVQTITVELADVDRAIIDDDTDGFVRVHHERGRLLGCTIVASHAGELIGEATFALTHRHTLSDLSLTIHPYPTQAEALRKAGDQYRRTLLTPRVRAMMERYFRWTR